MDAGTDFPVPGSPFALTLLGGTTGVLAVPLLLQNFGDLIAVGLQASSPWSGGTLMVSLKAKG